MPVFISFSLGAALIQDHRPEPLGHLFHDLHLDTTLFIVQIGVFHVISLRLALKMPVMQLCWAFTVECGTHMQKLEKEISNEGEKYFVEQTFTKHNSIHQNLSWMSQNRISCAHSLSHNALIIPLQWKTGSIIVEITLKPSLWGLNGSRNHSVLRWHWYTKCLRQ